MATTPIDSLHSAIPVRVVLIAHDAGITDYGRRHQLQVNGENFEIPALAIESIESVDRDEPEPSTEPTVEIPLAALSEFARFYNTVLAASGVHPFAYDALREEATTKLPEDVLDALTKFEAKK